MRLSTYLDGQFFDLMFRNFPALVRWAAEQRGIAIRAGRFPEEIRLNPEALETIHLFGIPIAFDSSLPPGKIVMVTKNLEGVPSRVTNL